MAILDTNQLIYRYFEEISQIPHGSCHEQDLADYIVALAEKHHLNYQRDEMHNVIVFKEASQGYEDHEPVMLQAHIDMVNEKNKESGHDFDHDPLKLYIEDGFLHAYQTTLGADDGCGVCYMLALLTDEQLLHPALECVFTVQEEIGLCGAMALDTSSLKARRLINLDNEAEGETCVSSSGGNDLLITKEITGQDNDSPVYVMDVKGLMGGHSGGCIHLGRGNANKIAGRILFHLLKQGMDIRLIEVNGGLKNNAIPRECTVAFASSQSYDELAYHIGQMEDIIKKELEITDPDFYVELHQDECDVCITSKDSETMISIMYLCQNGMLEMSPVIDHLPILSLNMGVIRTHDHSLTIDYSLRSPVKSLRDELCMQLETIAYLYGASVQVSNEYPGWDYDPHSRLRAQFKQFYQQYAHEPLKEVATHGGLETGVLKQKIPDLDIITYGPHMENVHTPDEKLDLASYLRCYECLVAFLETL